MRWKQYGATAIRLLRSVHILSFATSMAAGFGLAFGVSLAISTAGLTMPVTLGLLLAAAIGLDAGWNYARTISTRTSAISRAAFAGWVLLAPWLAKTSLTWFGAAVGNWAATSQGAFAAGTLVGLLCVGAPCFLCICGMSRSAARVSWLATVGLGMAVAAAPLIPIAVGGAQILSLAAAVLVALMETARLALGVTAPPISPKNISESTGVAWSYGSIAVCGAVLVVIARAVNQTMPASAQVLMFALGALAISIMCAFTPALPGTGRLDAFRRTVARAIGQPVTLAAIALSLLALFWLFPQVVGVQLTLNSKVSSPVLLLAARGLVTAMFVVPVGLSLGASVRNLRVQQAQTSMPAFALIVGVAVGFASVSYFGTPLTAVAVTACLGVVFWGTVRSAEGTWFPATAVHRIGGVAVLGTAVALPLGMQRFRPESASQLLFSSAVFREYAAGTDAHLLLATNEGRLLTARETSQGFESTWRFAGSRIQIRRNGIPVGLTTTDTATCPQPSMATLPVVLPLLIHESPGHVLLLGDAGPAAEATSLLFPIQSLTAIHTGTRTVGDIDTHFGSRREDDRFASFDAEPAVAIAGLNQHYDVIVSRPPQAALLESGAYYTAEFHERAARCLAENGLFFQTFNQVDFGPEPLRHLLQSLKQSFHRVAAIQLDGGELLLVATNGETIIRTGLAKRTSFAHVRRILDDLGWDWSKVLAIATVDSEAVDAILATSTNNNTAANAAFFWGLPMETMRWGDKQGEMRTQIAAYQRRILDQLEQDEFRDEAARRLSELGQEAELLFGFPDEPWMYRKTLRTRLEQNPRPPQEIVTDNKLKRQAHEVDTYRIDYFKTLANAAKSARSDESALSRLEAFTTPTEPLVSYFASHELVRIYEKLQHSPAHEFRHRLHTIYFVPGATRSVREVVAAMNLLVEHPEIIPGDGDRWDQMNSLMQILMGRWTARRNIPPRSSHVALNDIEKTLQAIDAGLAAMNEWRTEANIDPVLCQNREVFLRRRLERPLRRYREELLPHHYKAQETEIAEELPVDRFRALSN